ncbi:hypothetical protein LT330_005756 [Penicillium expansum]|nr:hypothetical protein LT330_005756 [Penicillium expansum]
MRFYTLTFILMATSASISLALPADPSSDKTASIDSTQWTCDNGWLYCGVCNGSSCKVGGINKRCVKGSCAGPKGGDGKHCGRHEYGVYQCPGY